MNNIYESAFVEQLFDRMSFSYSRMNYITSFGFSERWRRQCVNELNIKDGDHVIDFLSGMGECWKFILRNKSNLKLTGIDFSKEMNAVAKQRAKKYSHEFNITLKPENIFSNTIPDNTADAIISGFGLKTFNEEQLANLSKEINRILKPGGSFSLIDVSVPKPLVINSLYLFYLNYFIPVLGRVFLGNPETYKMLGIYTKLFVNAEKLVPIFSRNGLQVTFKSYFFGCATGIVGHKPLSIPS